MDHQFCPGSKLLRQPAPEVFSCPSCGEEVEIWTDEFKASCPKCHRTVFSDATMSCLDWCKYGKDCVGDTMYDRYMRNKAVGMKEQLLARMEKYFDLDQKRAEHAKKALHFAEELLKNEKGDWHIVIPASILHDVGIEVAENEGPPEARELLFKTGFKAEDIEQICAIIGHHHSPGDVETQNIKVLYDAVYLVNMQEKLNNKNDSEQQSIIERELLTESGKKLAMENYAKQTTNAH